MLDANTYLYFITETIIYDPENPNTHHPFCLSGFSNDEDPDTKVLSNGFTIMYPRVDPNQLNNGMYEMFLDDENEDSVIVKVPYLSFGLQKAIESRSARCKILNKKKKLLHREAHEDGINAVIQDVLDSSSTKGVGSFLSTYYRITFTGHILSDRFYGEKGHLNVQAVAWTVSEGVQEVIFDAQAHVRIHEEKDRFKRRQQKAAKSSSVLDDAMEGMMLEEGGTKSMDNY